MLGGVETARVFAVDLFERKERKLPRAAVIPDAVLLMDRQRFGCHLPQRCDERTAAAAAFTRQIEQRAPRTRGFLEPALAPHPDRQPIQAFCSNLE